MQENSEEKFSLAFSWLGTSLSGCVFVLVNNRITTVCVKGAGTGPGHAVARSNGVA